MNKIATEAKIFITHANCPDGMASAMIARSVRADIPVLFMAHGSDEYKNLVAEPGMVFCDITPPAERADEFIQAGAIVLDHHKSAEELVKRFDSRSKFASEYNEPGVSGAMLAYRHFYNDGPENPADIVYQFAYLAGIRDTWQKNSPDWHKACQQSELLTFYPKDKWFLESGATDWHLYTTSMLSLAPVILEKKLDKAKSLLNKAYVYEMFNRKIAIISSTDTSDAADEAALLGVELIIGFGYAYEHDKLMMKVSMRSKSNIDVDVIAAANGGGGHSKAAGFTKLISIDSRDPNPYTLLKEILEKHL
jgi:oligoribonuclease NrnB/cAMP/cGMP phosphodiesterase (DHH superfamily)